MESAGAFYNETQAFRNGTPLQHSIAECLRFIMKYKLHSTFGTQAFNNGKLRTHKHSIMERLRAINRMLFLFHNGMELSIS